MSDVLKPMDLVVSKTMSLGDYGQVLHVSMAKRRVLVRPFRGTRKEARWYRLEDLYRFQTHVSQAKGDFQ